MTGYVCHEKGVGPQPVRQPQKTSRARNFTGCPEQAVYCFWFRPDLVLGATVIPGYREAARFIADFEKHCVDFLNNAVDPEGSMGIA